MEQTDTNSVVAIQSTDTLPQLLKKAVTVRPSARQMRWQSLELTAFIHFGMNTFFDCEWGDGTADPAAFAPKEIDAAQWVRVLQDAGFKGLILTCKHHDGFCLWPSAYTDYSVKQSPYLDGHGDVVRTVSDACREAGMKFGVYLSPWDRHDARYGDSPAYNEYFMNQLTELLTNYGDIFEVWFDGACAEGANGKRQEYDWSAYYALIRRLQPDAVISIEGPDVRWVGNEAGKGRDEEWSVAPGKLLGKEGAVFPKLAVDAVSQSIGDIASLKNLPMECDCLFWSPAQVDTSIRPGWFYHVWENSKVKSLYNLIKIYDQSVGANAELLLNVPPAPDGRFDNADVEAIGEFGNYIREAFRENLVKKTVWQDRTTMRLILDGRQECDCIVLQEDIANGQRIGAFAAELLADGASIATVHGKTVGYKKIVKFQTVQIDEVRIHFTDCREEPILHSAGIYHTPDVIMPPQIQRDADGMVQLTFGTGAHMFFAVDDGAFQPYVGAFSLPHSGKVIAKAEYDANRFDERSVITNEQQFGMLKKNWVPVGNAERGEVYRQYLRGERAAVILSGFPCTVTIDLGETVMALGVEYHPVIGAMDFLYNVYEIEFQTATDGVSFKTVFSGRLDNMKNNPVPRHLAFCTPVECRYLRLIAHSGFDEKNAAIGTIDLVTK